MANIGAHYAQTSNSDNVAFHIMYSQDIAFHSNSAPTTIPQHINQIVSDRIVRKSLFTEH